MDKEYLIYVSIETPDKRGNNVYRFFFSYDSKKAEGNGWYEPYAFSNAEEPYSEHISSEEVFRTDKISFQCPQYDENTYFSYLDASEGVIAICWEETNSYEYETYNKGKYDRLVFQYGDEKKNVMNKLKERDIQTKFVIG